MWVGLVSGVALIVVFSIVRRESGSCRKEASDMQEDQVEAVHMQRVHVRARTNWQNRCEEIGFKFHSADGIRWASDFDLFASLGLHDPYWCEDGAYIFSQEAAVQLQEHWPQIFHMQH